MYLCTIYHKGVTLCLLPTKELMFDIVKKTNDLFTKKSHEGENSFSKPLICSFALTAETNQQDELDIANGMYNLGMYRLHYDLSLSNVGLFAYNLLMYHMHYCSYVIA